MQIITKLKHIFKPKNNACTDTYMQQCNRIEKFAKEQTKKQNK